MDEEREGGRCTGGRKSDRSKRGRQMVEQRVKACNRMTNNIR